MQALIVIRYIFKAIREFRNIQHVSVLDTVSSLPLTRWADNALWPLDVTLAFNVARCVPASKPPSIFIRQISQTPGCELRGSSLLWNRSRLHSDTCQSGRKWRSDSLNLPLWPQPTDPHPPFSSPSLFLPTSLSLSLTLSLSLCLKSIYYSICLSTKVQRALATSRSERWI